MLGDTLRDNSVEYVNENITLKLPNNKTLDDLQYLSVWCIDFNANFGDLRFTAP
ncbi:DM13 domain-containing protein [Pseudocolwellia sp. HL-MZ19]|uniref:DM13 domain-containing protein n=1 Tax=Pseudocolwellia sp. HL-MZ19 TaxID=3400846 RepID=UPI003CEB4709